MAALHKDAGHSQRALTAELDISQRMVAYHEGETDYPPAGILPDLANRCTPRGRVDRRNTALALPSVSCVVQDVARPQIGRGWLDAYDPESRRPSLRIPRALAT